jgi:putative PIN family toxin of toxin-antitoxin system
MDVVLDTNVWIAALRSQRGASRAVIDRVLDGDLDMHLTVPLVLEYEDILTRQRVEIDFRQEDVRQFIDLICAVGTPHEVHYLWRLQVPDPNDAHVLEAAVSSGCSHLVTFNKNDLEAATRFGIQLVLPRELLRQLRGSE